MFVDGEVCGIFLGFGWFGSVLGLGSDSEVSRLLILQWVVLGGKDVGRNNSTGIQLNL